MVQIRSPLPITAVEERLRRIVRSKQKRGFWDGLEYAIDPPANAPPFEGDVRGRTFKIVRVIRYRNSFLPVIHGFIADDPSGGTTIRLRMTLHVYTAIFMITWLSLVGSAVTWLPLSELKTADANALVPLGMLLFGVLLPVVGFYPEARKARRLIEEALARPASRRDASLKIRKSPISGTEAINRAIDEIGDQTDEFVATAARRVLEKTEW